MSLLSELKKRILKGREIITFILFTAVVYKGHGRDVYLGMNILLPFCYTVFFILEKGLFKKFTIYFF